MYSASHKYLDLIKEKTLHLQPVFQKEVAVLCGSIVRGDYVQGWSDIDLILITSEISQDEANRKKHLLEKHLGFNISVSLIKVIEFYDIIRSLKSSNLFKRNKNLDLLIPFIPFGFMKFFEVCFNSNQECITLFSNLKINISTPLKLKRIFYVAGIRDTILLANKILILINSNNMQEQSSIKKACSLLINTCRIVLRWEGVKCSLPLLTVSSMISNVHYLPHNLEEHLLRYLNIREDLSNGKKLSFNQLINFGKESLDIYSKVIKSLSTEWGIFRDNNFNLSCV